jgi:hypothetical protein
MQGQTIDVYQAGYYKVWAESAAGCTIASDAVYVPKDPRAYLWIVPEGCYNICLDRDKVRYTPSLAGPMIPFANWGWLYDNTTVQNGADSKVQDLPIEKGCHNYKLALGNGLCEATSIPGPEICGEGTCNELPDITCGSLQFKQNGYKLVSSNPCTIQVSLQLTNATLWDIPYIVDCSQATSIAGALGIAPAGSTNVITVTLTFAKGFNGTATIRYKQATYISLNCNWDEYTLTNFCDNFAIKPSQVLYGKPTQYNKAQTASAISMYPNPANSHITIEGSNIKEVNIIDMAGRKVYSQIANNSHNQECNIGQLQKGVYMVQTMLQDGKTTTHKLLKE